MKINARLFPLALHGPLDSPFHGCNLCERKSAKEFEVDNFGEARFSGRQFIERVAELREFATIRSVFQFRSDRRDFKLAAPLLRLPVAAVVDDEPAHYPRGVSHESRAVGEGCSFLLRHLEISLMQERGRAEGNRSALARKLALGQAVQLRVERNKKPFLSTAISAFSCRDQ